MRYLKIEWRNSTDLGAIYYAGGYTGRLFLDVEISKPEYQVDIEAEKDGENRDMPTFRKWEKAYRFDLWCTEDIVDCFTLMQIHDTITVVLQTGQQINVDEMTVSVEWPDHGCLAKLSVAFTEEYITGTRCDTNLDTDCYCEELAGDFAVFDEYPGTTAADGTIALLWTVEDIADKKYTGLLYQFTINGYVWILLPTPEQFSCYEDLDGNIIWFWDGQFWHLFPGYIISLTQLVPPNNQIKVIAYIPPGCFGTVFYEDPILGWVDAGDYTDDELAAGVTVNPPQDGSTDFKIEVWNHSCDYGETEIENIVII